MFSRSRRFVAAAILLAPGAVVAQGGPPGGPPPPPKNLQVLPKDLTRPQVLQIMRGVAGALGVRCDYCHVANMVDGREVLDPAADDKDKKGVARDMMRMVTEINDKLAGMGRTLTPRTRVQCETCHHGLSKPRTLQAEVTMAYEAKGADSAVARYRELRTQYFGRASFDFGEVPLVSVAEELSRSPEKRADAVRLLQLNLEFNPRSAGSYGGLANIQLAMGDTATAVASLEKVLEIDPNNAQARRALGQLKK